MGKVAVDEAAAGLLCTLPPSSIDSRFGRINAAAREHNIAPVARKDTAVAEAEDLNAGTKSHGWDSMARLRPVKRHDQRNSRSLP